MPTEVNELRKSMYVDDLISGKTTVKEAGELKQRATEIFQDATFTLHKWHSNEPALEEPVVSSVEDVTYANDNLVLRKERNPAYLDFLGRKRPITSESASIFPQNRRLLLKEEPCKSLQESMIHWDWCHPRAFKEN